MSETGIGTVLLRVAMILSVVLLLLAWLTPGAVVVPVLLTATVTSVVLFALFSVVMADQKARKAQRDNRTMYRLLRMVQTYPVPRVGAYEATREIQDAIRRGLER